MDPCAYWSNAKATRPCYILRCAFQFLLKSICRQRRLEDETAVYCGCYSLLAVGYARDQEAELATRGRKKGNHTS